jgi:type IV pilus assembly protein PilO
MLGEIELAHIGSWPKWMKNLILLGAAILTLVGGGYFGLNDVWMEWEEMKTKKEKLKKTLLYTQNQIANLDAYQAQVKEVKAALQLLPQVLPSASQEAELLERISALAVSSGLRFRSIKPLPEECKGTYMEQPIELILTGNYHGLGEFIGNIASLPRIVTLHDFSLKKVREKNKKAFLPETLELFVTAKIYWLVES